MLRTALLLLFLIPYPSLLAEEHGASTESGTAKTGKRLEADGKLSDEAVKFLSTHFFRSEALIRQDFETKIPTAIEKAIQNKDETEIAEILAGLVTTVSSDQAEIIAKDAKAEVKAETVGKDPGKFDTRYVALMERIAWAAMNRNGQLPESEKAKEFNKAFKEPYTKARDFAKLANEKSKQAAEGNAEAKKWVDQNIRKDTVLSIAEGLRKTGDKEGADALIGGQAFDLGNGQRGLDMWGPGKEPQRLYLGQNAASLTQAVDGFLKEKKSFNNNVTSRKELPNDGKLKSWFVSANGKFQKGSPKGFKPTPPVTPPNGGGGGGQGGTPVNTDIARLQSAIDNGNCKGCHTLEFRGTSLLDAELVKGGEVIRLADFATRFNNPSDPMAGPMRNNPSRQQFEEFARIQRGAK